MRAGVGICHKTGARAEGVLYDREVVAAGTKWDIELRVNWTWAGESEKKEAEEAEGILGYVLAEHWTKGRCWLGGDVARGLGWCHLESLRAYRLDETAYRKWVKTEIPPPPLLTIPTVPPTRSWCFRTLDLSIEFGRYRPDDSGVWGVDMFSVGPHSSEAGLQVAGSGTWAYPSWERGGTSSDMMTDRLVLTENGNPLLPGASVRGPLRHAFSRAARACGIDGEIVTDPHDVAGELSDKDLGGKVFGTVKQSSRVLIRDARVNGGWTAARLHMHAEDEFIGGSYGSAKRDAVRLLEGIFPVSIVVEGPDAATVDPLTKELDSLVALGKLGHLPVGGHKTKGSGWGHWITPEAWKINDVTKKRDWTPVIAQAAQQAKAPVSRSPGQPAWSKWRETPIENVAIVIDRGNFPPGTITLAMAGAEARKQLGHKAGALVAWWCEPAIDFSVGSSPRVFGREWPDSESLKVDEVCFFTERGYLRAAQTAKGFRWTKIIEDPSGETVNVVKTPVRLHGDTTRFSGHLANVEKMIMREWRKGPAVIGFTFLASEGKR